jgi:hypothetical protein
MSQDLFAAFGVPQTEQSGTRPTEGAKTDPFSVLDDISGPLDGAKVANNLTSTDLITNSLDDEDWGEFEGSSGVKATSLAPNKAPARYQYDLDDLGPPPKLGISKRQPPGEGPNNTTMSERNTSETYKSKPAAHVPKDPNVLFDASDEEDHGDTLDDFDDFGDFEEADGHPNVRAEPQISPIPRASQPTASFNPPAAEIDLLGLYDEPAAKPAHLDRAEVMSFGQTFANSSIKASTKTQATAKVRTTVRIKAAANIRATAGMKATSNVKAKARPKQELNDEPWEDFTPWEDDAPETVESQFRDSTARPHQSETPSGMHLKAIRTGSESMQLDRPPTTIPPPALILALFPSVFELTNKELLQPLSLQTQDQRKQALADPKTTAYLNGYLAVLVVCARIIAGRKLRWKRDTILAQSMRIGPASSGRLSGMKVTSIDKSETNREDREVAEVLRAWNGQVGKLKTVVAEAKKHDETLASIPEIRETMPIKVASELEGGVTSVKGCALCGLKRNERIGKVDVDVDDSFGEWWDDKVIMHRGTYEIILQGWIALIVIYSLSQFLG